MALYIKDPQAENLANLLADMLHSNKTRIVIEALEEKYEREKYTSKGPYKESPAEESRRMLSTAREMFGSPDLDTRSIDEIIGYDENGLPT